MYERILVALDGSELSERILPHAEALAREFGSTLILLRATTSPEKIIAELTTVDAGSAAIVDPTPFIEGERQEVDAYLAGAASKLRATGLTVQTERPEGPADEMILQRASELGVDLIAMTTH